MSPTIDHSLLVLVPIALIYVALVIAVRWHMIAHPIRYSVDARLKTLTADVHRLLGAQPNRQDETLAREVAEILKRANEENKSRGWVDVLFWSRGEETAVWQLVDQAASLLVATWSTPRLLVQLDSVRVQLPLLKDPVADSLAARIGADLIAMSDPSKRTPEAIEELRELYREAVRLHKDEATRTDFESDYYNNKILWHIFVSLAVIVIVITVGPGIAKVLRALTPPGGDAATVWTVTEGDLEQILRRGFVATMMAGAVGGILSGLTRVLGRTPSVQGALQGAHGVTWMAMFLSPLAGALAGWAGCVMLLGVHFWGILLPTTMPSGTLSVLFAGVAVVLGFSERFFVRLAENVEGGVMASAGTSAGGAKAAVAPAAIAQAAGSPLSLALGGGPQVAPDGLTRLFDDPRIRELAVTILLESKQPKGPAEPPQTGLTSETRAAASAAGAS